ncbi:MAG: sensor histidine kinase [Bacteroidia bacterium]
MNLYSNKQRWKIILAVLGIILIVGFLWYSNVVTTRLKNEQINHIKKWAETVKKKADLVKLTNQTFEQLKAEEEHKVNLYAKAIKEIEKDLPDFDMALYIISDNNIPLILTNSENTYLTSANISVTKNYFTEKIKTKNPSISNDSLNAKSNRFFNDSINKLIEEWAKNNAPITIKVDAKTTQNIYFRNSDKYFQLEHLRDSLIDGFTKDLENNDALVPFVFVDSSANNVLATNIFEIKNNTQSVNDFINTENLPISIELDDNQQGYIYYSDSPLVKTLERLPYLQLAAVLVFFVIAYLLFSTFRKAEQNQVWVGMAKETAHQLGTPISSLMAWIELLKSKGIDANTTDEMQKDIQRLETITERFSKIGSGSLLEEANIHEVLQQSIHYLQKRISNKVNIHFNLPEKNSLVNLNKPLFEWVIENLIKNAVDAMGGEGTITIDVSTQNNKTIIDITDTGKGIPNSKFKTIFEPGYTTKKRGWGLGLSLVKRIIEEYHYGKIFVKSSSPQGTTFRIVL